MMHPKKWKKCDGYLFWRLHSTTPADVGRFEDTRRETGERIKGKTDARATGPDRLVGSG